VLINTIFFTASLLGGVSIRKAMAHLHKLQTLCVSLTPVELMESILVKKCIISAAPLEPNGCGR